MQQYKPSNADHMFTPTFQQFVVAGLKLADIITVVSHKKNEIIVSISFYILKL